MRVLLGIIWVITTASLFGFGSWYYVCSIRGLCTEQNQESQTPNSQNTTQSQDEHTGNFWIAGIDGSRQYTFDNTPIVMRGSDEIQWSVDHANIIDTVYAHLNQHTDQTVTLTGYYTRSEDDKSMARKRLMALKDQMVSKGISPDKIVFKLLSKEDLYADSQRVSNSFEMGFSKITPKDYELIDKGIKNKTLYAKFGQGDFEPDRTLIAYVTDLSGYLDRNPSAKVEIIGHTDDVGKASSNFELGLKRAKNVRDYIVSRGVSAERLNASSKGEEDPIDSAKTQEAREKNRRIEVIVK